MPRGRTFRRTLARAIALAPAWVLVTAGSALADVQATPFYSDTPGPSKCSLTSPSSSCGQWTYWMSLGAIVVGLLVTAAVVLAYLRFAPRFYAQEATVGAGARAGGGIAQATIARPLAPPPAPAPPAAAPVSGVAGPATTTVPGPPAEQTVAPGTIAAGEEPLQAAPAAAAPAAAPATPRPPSPRPDPVEPDQETFDRVLAEQLAKGTDRRVAEGRAKAAALKAARERAQAS